MSKTLGKTTKKNNIKMPSEHSTQLNIRIPKLTRDRNHCGFLCACSLKPYLLEQRMVCTSLPQRCSRAYSHLGGTPGGKFDRFVDILNSQCLSQRSNENALNITKPYCCLLILYGWGKGLARYFRYRGLRFEIL